MDLQPLTGRLDVSDKIGGFEEIPEANFNAIQKKSESYEKKFP